MEEVAMETDDGKLTQDEHQGEEEVEFVYVSISHHQRKNELERESLCGIFRFL
jgi:hypothetical protein